jgi:hypothetical protein
MVKPFVLSNSNEIFSLKDLLANIQPANKTLNKTGIDFNDKASRIYWQNGMENPILINNNKAWKLSLQGNEINAELICTSVPMNSFIDFVQYSNKLQTLFIGTNSKGFFVIKHKQLNVLNPTVHDKNLKNAYYAQVELSNGNILTNNGNVLGTNPNNQLPAFGHFDFNSYLDQDSILWYSQ